MKYIFVCCLFFAVANAHPKGANVTTATEFLKDVVRRFDTLDEDGRISVINEFVDMALTEASTLMMELGFDPLKLPDLYKKISFKPIIITYWGDLNLDRGWLQDTSTIHRQGDVSLDYTNRILRMTVPIAFRDFVFDYQYRVRIMGLGPHGGVDGKTTDIRVRFELDLDFNKLQLELSDFEITRIGKIHISFSGNILTDWLLNLVTGAITTLFRGVIEWVCELVVKNVLVQIVDAVNEILAQLPVYETNHVISSVLTSVV